MSLRRVALRGTRWRGRHLEVQEAFWPAARPQTAEDAPDGKPAPSPINPLPKGAPEAAPTRKDTLQVVGALGGHRLRGVPSRREVHAQRFLQHPQG